MDLKDILVIKVGTSTLTKLDVYGNRIIDTDSFIRIGKQIIELQKENHGIILVSSAAISGGMAQVGMTTRPDKNSAMPELQRLASIGWRHILNTWADALPNLTIGELLLTKREIESDREGGGELMHVIRTLLAHGDIAIVNENDAITHSEIAFGDNDTLAAHIAAKINTSALFDCEVKLLLLTDVNGVYRDRTDSASIIKTIDNITSCRYLAANTESVMGTGGMETKFIAADIATKTGVRTWVGNGRRSNTINEMLLHTSGTYFEPKVEKLVH